MMNLTQNEITALKIALNYDNREAQLSDNYSNAGTYEIAQTLGISHQAAGGVMGSLVKKGLVDEIEQLDGDDDIMWLSHDGVNTIFDILESEENDEEPQKATFNQRDEGIFGAPKEEILEGFDRYISKRDEMMELMGRLSDTQEMIERGQNEEARKQLNIVKMLIAERVYNG